VQDVARLDADVAALSVEACGDRAEPPTEAADGVDPKLNQIAVGQRGARDRGRVNLARESRRLACCHGVHERAEARLRERVGGAGDFDGEGGHAKG